MKTRRARGQALPDYALCCAVLAAALFWPLEEGQGAAALLVSRLETFLDTLAALLALA